MINIRADPEHILDGSGSLSLGELSNSTFEGKFAYTKTQTVNSNYVFMGLPLPSTSVTQLYYDENYVLVGYTKPSNYFVTTQIVPVSAKLKFNDAGLWSTSKIYASSSKTGSRGTETVTYSLVADSDTSAVLTLASMVRDSTNTIVSTDTKLFRIDTNYNVTYIAEYTSAPGSLTTLTITFK